VLLNSILKLQKESDVFSEVDKVSSRRTASSKATWRGILSLNVPTLGLGSVQYHLRASKAHGNLKPVEFVRIDSETGKEVVSRDIPKFYHYSQGPGGERQNYSEIPNNEVRGKVRYDGDMVTAKNERRFFVKDDLEVSGKWTEVPAQRVVDKQHGEEIRPFDRTTTIEVDSDGFVPIERTTEYKFKEIYQLSADTEKKVRESLERVRQLARHLLDKHTALVSFFSWGRGYQYYTAVIFPYERSSDGKLWLLMGMSEGVLELDENWSLEENPTAEEAPPLPVATANRKTPKVTISK
jgi:hypothetical protein